MNNCTRFFLHGITGYSPAVKSSLILLLSCFLTAQSFGTTKTWIGSSGGNWSVSGNWSPAGGAPGSGDDVVISSGGAMTVNFDLSSATIASLTITNTATNGGSDVILAVGANALTVTGNITLTGDATGGRTAQLTLTTGTLNVGGNFTLANANGLLTAGTASTVIYNGAGSQSVAAASYGNLTVNKSAGTATASGSFTVNTVFN